jgi:cytochrome bd-type quinol oxidase subunit 2
MTTGDAAQDARRGWTPWLIGALVLPALGAVVTVAVVEEAGLDTWASWQAAAVLAATFVVPAAISAWVARSFGVVEALAWALACAGIQLALVFGVGFLGLGLGPGS